MKILHWFREDLRLADNPALYEASQGNELIALFVIPQNIGGASKWWLHNSLQSLSNDLSKSGVQLILRQGDPISVVPELAQEAGIDLLTWNRVYSPQGVLQGSAIKEALNGSGIKVESFNSQLLIEPTKVLNKQGKAFRVFTPFWKHCLAMLEPPLPLTVPSLKGTSFQLESARLETLGLIPSQPNWAQSFDALWQPGEQGAIEAWRKFSEGGINQYAQGRDFPGECNTSLLSPHLTWGEIGPNQLWYYTQELMAGNQLANENGEKFLSEIGWREFSRYLLVHFPQIEKSSFNPLFDDFVWQNKESNLIAWQKGQTGYPIVDAGMRELWQTGYMHNRVRMITASFLTKHLLCNWRSGMAWFWDTLVDADIANNTASWQWVAGCGADASPYFRIFNPILQGEKFDGDGQYTKRWVPELTMLPNKYLHKPWEASETILKTAGVELGTNYPKPLVDHKLARELALSRYHEMKLNHQ
ncbi:MAG: DNA photolyase family protein [Gammaproteobacteria bacterium]|nr:DNA photolyase family protein [Gammaproteobacteria bacterium]